jgi:5-methylcytosine-specific restriction endonuclease McrA
MAKKVQKEPKLIVELIPKTCQYINARTIVKSTYWDKIRHIVYKKANNKCEICGEHGLKQGFKHKLECHEVWKYQDRKKVQKLAKLMALCPLCHQAKHIGRTSYIGKADDAYERLKKINGWDLIQLSEHIDKAFEKNKERSNHKWTIDLSLLNKKPFNVPESYTQPPKKTPKKRY